MIIFFLLFFFVSLFVCSAVLILSSYLSLQKHKSLYLERQSFTQMTFTNEKLCKQRITALMLNVNHQDRNEENSNLSLILNYVQGL
jgi:hypothetical protein